MLFRTEKLEPSPTNREKCKICNKRMMLKIILVDCSHEFCYDCLFEIAQTSNGCLQCKDSARKNPNVENIKDKTPEKEAECCICLGEKQNKALVDACFHSFCFDCITSWSKTARQCPLCRIDYSAIYHDIKDDKTFKTFQVKKPEITDAAADPSDPYSTFGSDFSSLFNRGEALRRRMPSHISRFRQELLNHSNEVAATYLGNYNNLGAQNGNRYNPSELDQTFRREYESPSAVQSNDSQPSVSAHLRRNQEASELASRREMYTGKFRRIERADSSDEEGISEPWLPPRYSSNDATLSREDHSDISAASFGRRLKRRIRTGLNIDELSSDDSQFGSVPSQRAMSRLSSLMPHYDLLGSSMETRHQGPPLQGLSDERSFGRRNSSESGARSVIQSSSRERPVTSQSQDVPRTEGVRCTETLLREALASNETTPNNTPGIEEVSENNSDGRTNVVELSMPTPRRSANGSENSNPSGITVQTLPIPRAMPPHLPGNPKASSDPVSVFDDAHLDSLTQKFQDSFQTFLSRYKKK